MPGEEKPDTTGAADSVFGSKTKPSTIEDLSNRWEAWLRNRTAFIFLTGFAVFAGVFVHATGLKEWYEFAILISALVVGTLVTRARRIRVFGAELELETMIDAVLFEQAIRNTWGWPVHRYPPPQYVPPSPADKTQPDEPTSGAEQPSGVAAPPAPG